jgi:poly(hydroxyalkanoate) granule-associated protein
MVKKVNKDEAAEASRAGPYGSVKDSAQQIWQAGLGAFARAQAEGTKAFEALVQEGTKLQRKTQAAAEERIAEATSRVSNMANDISSKATGHWDKLENIFEERVARALNKLGVPSAKDISALIARIDDLNQTVQKLSAGASTRAAKGSTASRRASAKAAAAKSAAPAARNGARPRAAKKSAG